MGPSSWRRRPRAGRPEPPMNPLTQGPDRPGRGRPGGRFGWPTLLLVLACLAAAPEAAAQVIRSGPAACRAVAFTFDMCPVRGGSGYDEALIQWLVEHRVPATFFLSGRWAETH